MDEPIIPVPNAEKALFTKAPRQKTITKRELDSRLHKRQSLKDSRANLSQDQLETRARIEAFRDRWQNSAMPAVPRDLIPGFHICWVSTQSKVDTVQSRLALGYELVRIEDVQHPLLLASPRMASGQYEGVVNCAELVLMKIPEDLYQEVMCMLHHEEPLAYQRDLTEHARQAAYDNKSEVNLEEGLLQMERQAQLIHQRPHFQ